LTSATQLEAASAPGILGPDREISYEVMQNLNDAPGDSVIDGTLSYNEVLDKLNLDGYGFHLRGSPTLERTEGMLERADPGTTTSAWPRSAMWRPANLLSIRTCIMLIDADGDAYDRTGLPSGTQVGVGGREAPADLDEAGALPVTQFATPLALNSRGLSSTPIGLNDMSCQTQYGLALGGYYYGAAQATAGYYFESLYNDAFTDAAMDLDVFIVYDGWLFDADASNDNQRDTNADGQVILPEGTPPRALVAVLRVDSVPIDDDNYSVFCHQPGSAPRKP
jgi:hypothetical protein